MASQRCLCLSPLTYDVILYGRGNFNKDLQRGDYQGYPNGPVESQKSFCEGTWSEKRYLELSLKIEEETMSRRWGGEKWNLPWSLQK
jgi:hypothetical protein